jgi:hypothetical protein
VSPRSTVRAYYDALRAGDPLGPFFADGVPTIKFGVSERLVGIDAVEAGLAAQTATTAAWTVESGALRVTARPCHAWFSDEVLLAWTDTERDRRHEYDTRWSGTLESRDGGGEPTSDGDWRFVGMHVSTADDLGE